MFLAQADVQVTDNDCIDTYIKMLPDCEELIRRESAKKDVFSVDCGDIVGDSPALYPAYINAASRLNIPVYRAIGNHDMDYYGRSFETSHKTFEKYFGPTCYSFNKGKAHYIILNDNFYVGRDYFYMAAGWRCVAAGGTTHFLRHFYRTFLSLYVEFSTGSACVGIGVAGVCPAVSHEEWMTDCRIWMYRGAWAEWEIDHIEMAVPISPEELRRKRNSILKHQSQMESAPFLGNDERLFWQRSEDRNLATAGLYKNLGLASYEAIEAFVEYKKPQ